MATRQPLDGAAHLLWDRAGESPQGALFDRVHREIGYGEFRGMEFLEVEAHTIINEVKGGGTSPAIPFRFTINPYRGCSHACTYCFARPTHAYLGLGIGVDFDQRVVVKVNAVEKLRAELRPSRWAGDLIAMGTNTDPYQRCEGKYRLTQGLIRTLVDAGNPFSVLTKSTLILRDVSLLREAARTTDVRVNLSIGTLDDDVWRLTEPGTPHPRRRLRAVEQLNEAGVPCGVLMAPILPGLSDGVEQLQATARACVEAGAVSVSSVLLHLRPGVRDHFLEELAGARPDLVSRYERMYTGPNAPKAERQRVATIVREAVRAAGGQPAPRFEPEHLVGRPVAEPRRRAVAHDGQLTLGM